MRIRGKQIVALVLALAIVGCGGDDGSTQPASATATATRVATATLPPPVLTATPLATFSLSPALAPSHTATPLPATATVTHSPAASTATATTTATASATPIIATSALFSEDPTSRSNPFPSDRLLDATGHVALSATTLAPDLPVQFQAARDFIARSSTQLNALTGFSTFAPIRVPFSEMPVVGGGLYPNGLVLLEYADLSAAPWPIRASVYAPDRSIEVQPVVPLKSKTTYALIVTKAIRNTAGAAVEPSPEFAKLLAGSNLNSELSVWRSKLQPVIDYLPTLNIRLDNVVMIDLFTTQPTTDDLVAIQGRLVSGELKPGLPNFTTSPLSGFDVGVFAEGTPQFTRIVGSAASAAVQTVGAGTFESYDFRRGNVGVFETDSVYGSAIPRKASLEFFVTVPKAPKPANGYPIVLFGHGFGGSAINVVEQAKLPGDLPFMNIGISALQHGRRGNVANFFILSNIFATREFFRQTIADMMQLTRMIKLAHDAGIAPFDQVDPDKILYRGISLGGIMGAMYMAVEPQTRVGMLSVPGGGLPNIIASPNIGQLLEPLVSVNSGIPIDDPSFRVFLHVFQLISQWALDPADPINYAPHLIVPGEQLARVPLKHVLVHEGIIDTIVPNRTTEDLALAMRLPDLNFTNGCDDPEGCSGIWRYVMADYDKPELSGHGATYLIAQATAQMQEYLRSFGTVVIEANP